MRIAIGADHAGFHLKQEIITCVRDLGHEYEDFGTHSSEAVDYPDVAQSVARSVADDRFDRGILICGTGAGMCMTANKVRGIRAVLCHDTFSAHATRSHNDANVLCMGGRVIAGGLACHIVKVWLETPFSQGERHVRRVAKVNALDRQ